MEQRVQKALLVLSVLGFLGITGCAAPALNQGYYKYRSGRLLFKLPSGEWEQVKRDQFQKVPAPYKDFIVGVRPKVVLEPRIRPAVILIWSEKSYRDLSKQPLDAYKWLEEFLRRREKAVRQSNEHRYFDYELLDGAIAATTSLEGEPGDVQVRGSGKAMLHYHGGDSYLYYFELLADSDVFDAVNEEFIEALKGTHGY